MSTEENKVAARRIIEFWNGGDLGVLDEIIAPDYVRHWHGTAARPKFGPEWFKQLAMHVRAVIPDLRFTAEDLLADGDKVVMYYTGTGSQQGEYASMWGPVPPTGKKVAWTGITILRVADGQIAEEWLEEDRLGLYQQMGAIPSPSR